MKNLWRMAVATIALCAFTCVVFKYATNGTAYFVGTIICFLGLDIIWNKNDGD